MKSVIKIWWTKTEWFKRYQTSQDDLYLDYNIIHKYIVCFQVSATVYKYTAKI